MLLLSRTVEERNGRRLQGYGDSGAPDTADGRRRIGLSVQNNDKDARKNNDGHSVNLFIRDVYMLIARTVSSRISWFHLWLRSGT